MDIKKTHLVYFSATKSTRHLVREIANTIGVPFEEHDITKSSNKKEVQMDSTDLLIIGVPSYSGRVPAITIPEINRFKGNNTSAIIVCTYGNRHYDDTLLELKHLVTANGFKVISAGAFVARHSIFPVVGVGRPDAGDDKEVVDFAEMSIKVGANNNIKAGDLFVKGNSPYRKVSNIPLRPSGDSKCDKCGVCVHMCPTDAILESNPKKTIKKKCISCARCISVCPQGSRAFRGFLYKFVSKQFVKKCSAPQENEVFYMI